MIVQLAKQNSGDLVKESKAKHVKYMKASVEKRFTAIDQNKPITRANVAVASNTLFSPFQLVQAHELKWMSDENKVRKRAEDKAKAKEAKAAKRTALTCAAEGCVKRTTKEGGAKGWSKCFGCLKLYCKNHKQQYNACVLVCATEEVEGKPVTVAQI